MANLKTQQSRRVQKSPNFSPFVFRKQQIQNKKKWQIWKKIKYLWGKVSNINKNTAKRCKNKLTLHEVDILRAQDINNST